MHMDGHAFRSVSFRPLPGVLAALTCFGGIISAQAPTEKGRLGLTLTQITTPWTGDLDGMVERRMVRVLTAFSKTQYFIDRGTPRGTAYDQGRLLEEDLNKTLGKTGAAIHVQFVPLARNELLPALIAGKGDIVMADLTVTPERLQEADFTDPWIDGVDEIVVTRPGGPVITTVDDLSGKEVFVRESSSYYQSLIELNARLEKDGKPPAKITPAPEELEDEDLLEMANAGLVDVLVVDNYAAWFWQRVWPGLRLYPTAALFPALSSQHAVRHGRRRGGFAEALHRSGRALPEVRSAVRDGLDADGCAGLPGITAGSQRAEPRRRDRRDAGDAGHRHRAESRRHQEARAEHSRGSEIHPVAGRSVLRE